jgi:nucleoside-diphosphate-sugar epimerase
MRSALIGHTGFVGGNLLLDHSFEGLYHSANVEEIVGQHFDLVVCAGAPAVKWKANQHPLEDRACLSRLMVALEQMTAERFILISTVDVYGQVNGVDEDCSPTGATPYGLHRLELEQFVARQFNALIVRLPALFGPGLKKNTIYDLLNTHAVEKIDSRSVFQFYDVRHLWHDISVVTDAGLSLIHLATEPVSMAEVAREAFGFEWVNHLPGTPAAYDLRTRHATLFGGSNGYVCGKDPVLADLAAFVRTQRELKRCA